MIKDQMLARRPLNILEKIEESLEKLNEKMEVIIEIQKNSGENPKD